MGLSRTLQSLRSANGTAQHLLLGVWGVIIAGMYHNMGVPDLLLLLWTALSVAVVVATVWLNKTLLKYLLVADVMVSVSVLVLYATHTKTVTHPMGMVMTHSHFDIGAHFVAAIVMILHGLYLADLTNRQILESRRFHNE